LGENLTSSSYGEGMETGREFAQEPLMEEKSIDIWKKLDWVADQGGMVLLNVHPDYLNIGEKPHYEGIR